MVNQKIPNVPVRHVNSGNLRSFKPIVDAWIDVILQKYVAYFSRSEDMDSPWWYNERATVSSLAAAAWMAEGIALEEYRTQKGKKSNPRTGRCDLFLGAKSGAWFECEAKHTWCAIGRKARKGFERAKSGLKDAFHNAKQLPKTEGVRRLGLCFLIPYLPIGDKDYVVEQIEKWLKELDGLERDCIAWTFPEKTRYFEGSDKQIYPGVVLLVKEV